MKNLVKSQELYSDSQNYLVGGVNSPVRSFASVGGNPIFIQESDGNFITDVDGNKYFDFVLAYGPMILGHKQSKVSKALIKAIDQGYAYGTTSANEITLAKLILESFPHHDKIRFVNSGTEAVFSAIRLARAVTGKNKIIKFAGCYHGHTDSLLVAAGSGVATHSLPGSLGVPQGAVEDTLIAEYNNFQQVEDHFTNHKDIGAIIIEPIAGNMGVVLPQNNFLGKLKEICQKNNALLIIDEVMTGYRSCFGGCQTKLGVEADITCLGKIIGGGLAIGAYLARKEIMDNISPLGGVYQAGTFSGNPLAMATGIATLNELKAQNPYEKFDSSVKAFADALINAANTNTIPLQVNYFGSMFNPFFTNHHVIDFPSAQKSDTKLFNQFFWLMLEEGYFLPPSQFESWFLATTITEQDIQNFTQAVNRVFLLLKQSQSNTK